MTRTLTAGPLAASLLLVALLAGCSSLPGSGPPAYDVEHESPEPAAAAAQVVDVDDAVARRLMAHRQQTLFSEVLAAPSPQGLARIGVGDGLEVSIFEAPPAVLFGSGVDPASGASPSRAVVLPEQVVDRDGAISLPFAGRVQVAGRTTEDVAAEVTRRLQGKAHQPQVIVRFTRNPSADVTVVGEVAKTLRFSLTPAGERLLDALAEAGGARQPVNKTTIQVSRGGRSWSMPLDQIIRDPRQNVPLVPGDVVTAIATPYSFTALGATGRNDEITFEAQGISLAQAIARAGGLVDTRSNPQGIFVFRYEDADALDWPTKPVTRTPDGRVPVVYRVNLRNPGSFFAMQNFAMDDHDIIYISNAPVAELQKFLSLIFSVTIPTATVVNAVK